MVSSTTALEGTPPLFKDALVAGESAPRVWLAENISAHSRRRTQKKASKNGTGQTLIGEGATGRVFIAGVRVEAGEENIFKGEGLKKIYRKRPNALGQERRQ